MSSSKARRGAGEGDAEKLLQRTLEVIRNRTRDRSAGQERSANTRAVSQPEARQPGRLWNKPSLVPELVRPLVVDRVAHRRLSDLILHDDVREEVSEFLEEYANAGLLRSHSLEPRHKLLLLGPPGNGKTSLAEAIAYEAGLPFLTVRYDAMMDSLLGETASRLRRLMDFAASCPCLLFFDEFDSVGKERGDAQDIGEVKRVVGSLLVQLDDLPSHTVVVCATNHPELLDRAVWRRFDLRLAIEPPGAVQLREWFRRLKASLHVSADVDGRDLLDRLGGQSFSEVEKLGLDIRRKLVLARGGLTPDQALQDAVVRWSRRLSHKQIDANDAGTPAGKAPKRARSPRREKGAKEAEVPERFLV